MPIANFWTEVQAVRQGTPVPIPTLPAPAPVPVPVPTPPTTVSLPVPDVRAIRVSLEKVLLPRVEFPVLGRQEAL